MNTKSKSAGEALGNEPMPIGNPLAALEDTPAYRMTRLSLVRAYIGRKPRVREAQALDTTARLMVRCHLAAADPSVTPDALCKMNAASKHALELLKLTVAEHPRRLRPNPDLVRMLSAGELTL
jgi:hypothetical protein